MKTNMNSPRKYYYVSLIAILLVVACQKDEVAPLTQTSVPSLNNSKSAVAAFGTEQGMPVFDNSKSTVTDLASTPLFTVMRIAHEAARTTNPDYILSVNSDGGVVFQGIRNVSHIGTFKYRMSPAAFVSFNRTLNDIDFYSIVDNNELIMDVPVITTTYQRAMGADIRTLYDYDNGYPSTLVALRTKVESLINADFYIKPAVANAPQMADPGSK